MLYQSNFHPVPGITNGSASSSSSSSSLPGKYYDNPNNSAGMVKTGNGNGFNTDYKGKGRISSNDAAAGNDYLALDMGNGSSYGGGDGSMQQMQLQQTQQVRFP